MDVNELFLEGRLVRDAEYSVKGDVKVSRFTLVHNRAKKNDKGEYEEKPNFFNLAIFGNYAEKLTGALVKGRKVLVVGYLVISTYEKDGVRHDKPQIRVKDIRLGMLPSSGNKKEPEEEFEYMPEDFEYVEGYNED